MTSLATFGTFVLAALGSVFGLYRFYLSQRGRRDQEIEARARERFTLEELQRQVEEMRRAKDGDAP